MAGKTLCIGGSSAGQAEGVTESAEKGRAVLVFPIGTDTGVPLQDSTVYDIATGAGRS